MILLFSNIYKLKIITKSMRELLESAYSLNDHHIKRSEDLNIIVHPFYSVHWDCLAFHESTRFIAGSHKEYYKGMQSFIKCSKSPILVLEEKDKLMRTMQKLYQWNNSNSIFLVETHQNRSLPLLKDGWDGLAKMLEQFQAKNINFAGGQIQVFDYDAGIFEGRCLGTAIDEITLVYNSRKTMLHRLMFVNSGED